MTKPRKPWPKKRKATPKKAASKPASKAPAKSTSRKAPVKKPGAPLSPTLTPDKLGRFLERLAQCGDVRSASRAAKVHYATVYRHMKTDEQFKIAVIEAREIALDCLEGEGFRRAMKSSDALLMFMMKSNRRALYGDSTKLTGDRNEPVAFTDLTVEGAMAAIAEIFADAGLAAAEIASGGVTGKKE